MLFVLYFEINPDNYEELRKMRKEMMEKGQKRSIPAGVKILEDVTTAEGWGVGLVEANNSEDFFKWLKPSSHKYFSKFRIVPALKDEDLWKVLTSF